MAFENFENQSSQLEDEETGLTKNPQRKEETELDDAKNADDQQATVDTPEGYNGGKRERQNRVDPEGQNTLSDTVYENYYADKSLDDLKGAISYLNQVRQQADEVKLLRFVTGRGEQKPHEGSEGVIQRRPDLDELFAVGSLSDPDEQSRYMTDVSAAHDLIEYLVSETETAIRRKENEAENQQEHDAKKPEHGELPTDTAVNPGEVPENVQEGKGGTSSKESSEKQGGEEQGGDDPEQSQDPESEEEEKQRGETRLTKNPREQGETRMTKKPEEQDMPDAENEEEGGGDPESQEEGEEMPDIPGPEDLQEEPPQLKEAREKYLKAVRIRGSILRGEYVQKAITFIPGIDQRSVTHDGEELFFGRKNGESNLNTLRDNYTNKLEADRDKKVSDFVANELESAPEDSKEQAITKFAQNLLEAQQENQNEAIDAMDESFSDQSFRDFWRRDDVWWTRMGLSGAGLTASLAGSAATGGAGYATWRTAVGTASGYTMAEGYLEQTDMGFLRSISRRGAVSDIESELDEGANRDEVRSAIEDRFSVDYNNPDNQNLELKRELNRMRMLANEMGTSVEEAAAGGNNMTARIIRQMQDMERDIVADKAIEKVQKGAEGIGNLEDEAVKEALMSSFESNEDMMTKRMEREGDKERVRKMKRKIGGALAGAGMGWLIGSGRMGNMLREGAEKMGDAWEGAQDWFWPGGADTPPAEPGPGMGELPPEMQPEPEAETIFDVEVSDWDGQEVYGDETKARSFIEATGDIKSQMQDLNAFDVAGAQGSPLDNLQAAENLQEFLGDDIANDLAERLDGYRPEQIKESLVVHPGETLSVTTEGNLILEQTSGETELLYNGAEDQVNTDVLKDDLFGDFDDVSGSQAADQSPDLAGEGTQEASKVEGAGVENPEGETQMTADTSVSADGGLETQLSETVVANNPDQANGVMKGAVQSYTESLGETNYNPEYISDISRPEGMGQRAFDDHIKALDQQDELLNKLPEIAENNPERLQAFSSLFDSYAEANMTPPGVDISDTQELETLYESTNEYIENKAGSVSAGEVDAAGGPPEPPSADSAGAQTADGESITGEGRNAEVNQPDGQAGQEVTGEGRGAEVKSEPTSAGEETGQQGTAQTEGEPSPADAGQENPINERLQTAGGPGDIDVRSFDISAEEVNNLDLGIDQDINTHLSQSTIRNALIQSSQVSSLENIEPEVWTNLSETFETTSQFSEGVDQLIENGQQEQLDALFRALEAEQAGDLTGSMEPDAKSIEAMQAYINDQYEIATNGDTLPALEPETVNPGYNLQGIPELTAEVSGDEQLFEAAQREFAPGEVFSHNGKTYVFTEGLSTNQAYTKARGALSAAAGDNTISSSVEYQLPAEYRDGSDQAAALVQLGLN